MSVSDFDDSTLKFKISQTSAYQSAYQKIIGQNKNLISPYRGMRDREINERVYEYSFLYNGELQFLTEDNGYIKIKDETFGTLGYVPEEYKKAVRNFIKNPCNTRIRILGGKSKERDPYTDTVEIREEPYTAAIEMRREDFSKKNDLPTEEDLKKIEDRQYSIPLSILSFILPVIGIVYYFVQRKKKPRASKFYLKIAIVGTLLRLIGHLFGISSRYSPL